MLSFECILNKDGYDALVSQHFLFSTRVKNSTGIQVDETGNIF